MPRPAQLGAATLIVVASLAPAAARSAPPPRPVDPPRLSQTGPRPPWRARRRVGVRMRAPGTGLINLKRWPAEPRSPATASIDVRRFGAALHEICGWMPRRRRLLYARWILEASKRRAVDPFLVAALVYRQSLCRSRLATSYGLGLTQLNERMHAGHFRGRRYRYWVLRGGAWHRRQLAVRHLYYRSNLLRAQPNIRLAAALLSIFSQQCPAIDRAFGSIPHRHPVSHFVWGDRVRDTGAEDRLLLARRRLLQYYGGRLPAAKGRLGALALRCPLDGGLRKISSEFGDPREDGARAHKGIDFASIYGEQVRAVADGRVVIAGIDAARGPSRNLPYEKARKVPRSQLGAGGLYVMIRHRGGLRSAYMHLSSYTVRAGQQVKAGQLIGRVGRSGMKISAAHLHFELRKGGRHLDPLPALAPYLIRPAETYLGRRLAYERWRTRRRRRHRRRAGKAKRR